MASLVALTLGCGAATFIGFTDAGRTLELTVSDTLRTANALPEVAETAQVSVIEIDDGAIAHGHGGRWPWPRIKQAMIVDALASLGPRLIVLDIEYSEAETSCVARRPKADATEFEKYVLEKPDHLFRESLQRAGNVVVPFSLYYKVRHGGDRGTDNTEAPDGVEVKPYLRRHAIDVPSETARRLLAAEAVNPMIPQLGAVAAGSGYTSLLKDADQSVRRVPLLARAGRYVFPHLGVEMAGLWQYGPDYRVRLDKGRFVLMSADGAESVVVPVDDKVQMSLRWPRSITVANRDVISAGPVLDLVYNREALENLRERWRLVMGKIGAMLSDRTWAETRAALEQAEAEAKASPDDAALKAGVTQRRQALQKAEERVIMVLMEHAARARDGAEDNLAKDCATAVERFGPFIGIYHEKQDEFVADVAKSAARLRPHVEGRLCILGLNITAGTDQHKTPISRSQPGSRGQPGVTVYPSVMRTILSGVAFRHMATWQDWLIAVLAAWLVGVLGVRLPTGWGIAATVWLSTAVVVIGYVASATVAVLPPVAGPVAAIVLAFAGVSGYRQLTEASSRRWITRVFQQYTSAAHVEEIMRDPEALRLGGERRDITVIFSDITGFTPLSERMNPEQLVSLLNRYLGAMTEVLMAEGATLDKYEGDGILAFIGAPVQVTDHALRAVRAALAMQNALPKINDDLIHMGLLPEGARLRIRVSCSSGPASVGNFGSQQRFDYTAMGDTVNLGGRLEEANRWLKTKILVSQATRDGCDEAVLFRRLGAARIRGKAQPMPLYEPLALEPAPEKAKAVAQAFGRAIDALEAGQVDAAEAAVADLVAIDPDDGPAVALGRRIQAVRAGEMRPEDPWNLARPKEEAAPADAE